MGVTKLTIAYTQSLIKTLEEAFPPKLIMKMKNFPTIVSVYPSEYIKKSKRKKNKNCPCFRNVVFA